MELNNTQLNIKKLLTIQNEWTRIEDILTAEQKWLDEVGVSILDLTKITSINYVQTLSNTQVKTKTNNYILISLSFLKITKIENFYFDELI